MKRTLITCANSGIGSEIAKKLAHTDQLLLAARNQTKLCQLNADLGQRAEQYALDFFDSSSIQLCSERINGAGQLDNLVLILPRIEATSEVFPEHDEWCSLLQNYFVKPLGLLKCFVENGTFAQKAKIVIVSGLSSKSALSHYSANNSLRSTWLGQAKTMSLALGPKGISVNTLSLGGVMTDAYISKLEAKASNQGLPFEALMENEVANIPLKKYATVGEVADAAIALLGPIADHMTGQNILVDGGFFRGY
ncbi:SDR family oxidoreductase [Vibrio sp. S4M6]|uniref:SDR family oxidoreductase n=1 Tax=Vibrio sinus TaxID=2946865 RepID=UPI00202A8B50|nr:SDR family oxidoreductase [Vibrio sinus]MCL9780803.1 SDR family oxidoreductase [Vibrio sinus]